MEKFSPPRSSAGALGFVSSDLDRRADLRAQPHEVARLARSSEAKFIGAIGDSIRTEQGQPDYRSPDFEVETIFLGVDQEGHPWLAYQAPVGVEATGIRPMLLEGRLPAADISRFAQARSMVHWHERHGFCANCGEKTDLADAGYKRQCAACKAEHFPRTDPVVIMAIVHDNAVLLGRQAAWPQGMYSALAGFMEPGETIEQSVRRETWEEAGVQVGDVRYIASQPWPFPASLMIGVIGSAHSRSLNVDKVELEDARWFGFDEARLMLARRHPDNLTAANPAAIAHHLITIACCQDQ